ncbi:peptidylprolyl isomerase [Flavobacteriaceae bacterium S356]|uniref:Peptidyl-prolyl cis-trans isomerase n=1 Tax=Asprobacillus argus TaxID=3076534 RepID=A0ABU3LHJ5_9FLAO|nr:peptidylprolyl isomerase [Flavobacteriaceae bacterium S356]
MKYSSLYVTAFLLCLASLYSCKQKEVQPKEKVVLKKVSIKKIEKPLKKEVVKKVTRDTDTINKNNVVAFLTAYGKQHPETVVLFETRFGNIKIRLYRDTPLHRANFIFLTKKGYFSTTCFHRVVPNFIIQGGNSDHPLTRKLRTKYNYVIPPEIKSHRKHKYGALAAAREWDNNPKKLSSPYEFYMIQDKRGSHHLDGEHTIFGEIIEGISTMEKIAALETDSKEWPIRDVYIKARVLR